MILDTQNRFTGAVAGAGQSIAAVVSDVISIDVVDTQGVPNPNQNVDKGIGEAITLAVYTRAAVTSGGAATVQFILQSDDNVGFASPREFPLTAALALAALTANTLQYRGALPQGIERFIRVVARIAVATTTGGSMEAFVAKDLADTRNYASGFVVA